MLQGVFFLTPEQGKDNPAVIGRFLCLGVLGELGLGIDHCALDKSICLSEGSKSSIEQCHYLSSHSHSLSKFII